MTSSSYILIFHHLPSVQQFAPEKEEATIVDNLASGGVASSLQPDKECEHRNKMEIEEQERNQKRKSPSQT